MDGNDPRWVHQAIMLYDTRTNGFRAVVSTLPETDSALASPALTSLADAPYRHQDAESKSTLCFADAPDGRGMVIRRFYDASSGRPASAAHVLIGHKPKVGAGLALGLFAGWPGWWNGGPPPELHVLDRQHLVDEAEGHLNLERNRDRLGGARAIEHEEELTRLIVALIEARDRPLAVTPHRSHPVHLLIAAREILREWVSPDWTFSTGDPEQNGGIHITFMLPEGRIHSENHVNLATYPAEAPHLITAANLVRAYTNSHDAAAWSQLLRDAGITSRESLLTWAQGFTPTSDEATITRRLGEEHNKVLNQERENARTILDLKQRELDEILDERETLENQIDTLTDERDDQAMRARRLEAQLKERVDTQTQLAQQNEDLRVKLEAAARRMAQSPVRPPQETTDRWPAGQPQLAPLPGGNPGAGESPGTPARGLPTRVPGGAAETGPTRIPTPVAAQRRGQGIEATPEELAARWRRDMWVLGAVVGVFVLLFLVSLGGHA
ncbi:conserved hypothetical protein [Frankia sp. AiPs1]|uniref:hypothetical protein n=1 Tax=Frankia sp. AiPa1 TaxID=573492 RepID=UPI00202B91F0|nr:hypothetical protein [Frankia sp. AiPa1]MCL9760498.1 hypothetical protein [Frankia sp. AiPa1]